MKDFIVVARNKPRNGKNNDIYTLPNKYTRWSHIGGYFSVCRQVLLARPVKVCGSNSCCNIVRIVE